MIDRFQFIFRMAFLKLAKLSVGGVASVIGLSMSGMIQAKQQENIEDNKALLPNVYFILKQGNSLIGTIVMELRSDVVPKTAENFRGAEFRFNFQDDFLP